MPEQSAPLRDMIQKERARGTTYRQLAERAVDPTTGTHASYSLINNIVLGKADRMPQPEHLRAIAAGLDIPYEEVRQAAFAQWYPADDAAADNANRLEEIATLKDLARDLLERADRLQNETRPEPGSSPRSA